MAICNKKSLENSLESTILFIMTKRVIFLFLSSILLTGCFAQSMTLVGTGAGASQGRLLQSSISSIASYGIKEATGKFPLEHAIKRQKQRIAKKTSDFENKIIEGTKKTIKVSKEKILPVKNNIKNKVAKFSYSLNKAKTFAEENFKHKPRFSYKAR